MDDAGVKSEVSRHNKICSCGFVALTIPPRRFFSRPFDHLTRDYVMARDYLPRERPGILGVSFCTLRGLREKYVMANSLIFSCLFFFFFQRENQISLPPLSLKSLSHRR